MECYWCGGKLVEGSSIDTDASMHRIFYDKYSVMTNLHCTKCESEVYILKKRDAFDQAQGEPRNDQTIYHSGAKVLDFGEETRTNQATHTALLFFRWLGFTVGFFVGHNVITFFNNYGRIF